MTVPSSANWPCAASTPRRRFRFPVCYKGLYIGEYLADLVVEEKLIVELKCVEHFANEHLAQCINYLKVSGLRVALLINFQRSKLQRRRVLLDPENRNPHVTLVDTDEGTLSA